MEKRQRRGLSFHRLLGFLELYVESLPLAAAERQERSD
jgi:hypothetical protein